MSVRASWTRVVFVPVVLLLSFFDPRLCICEKNVTYVFWSSLPLTYLLLSYSISSRAQLPVGSESHRTASEKRTTFLVVSVTITLSALLSLMLSPQDKKCISWTLDLPVVVTSRPHHESYLDI